MNTPLLGLPLSAPIPDVVKKKRVLLIDTSPAKRDLRAEVMRKLGMAVDCAADIAEAKAALSADLGDLTQRWRILEAPRRISAVRSACSARARAMQDRPLPPRDFEGPSKRNARSLTLDELLREEMQ